MVLFMPRSGHSTSVRLPRFGWLGCCLLLVGFTAVAQAADEAVDYERDVQPILRTRCYECHDGGQSEAGLRLDLRAGTWQGGESGEPAVVPGQVDRSPLLARVTSSDPEKQMPPEGERLTAAEVETLRRWIEAGAVWPDALAGESVDARQHWAFQPPRRPALPKVSRPEWTRNAIDAFVLAQLDTQALQPSPEADKVTLIRRLSLDLLGLPPTTEEVDAFVLDHRPDAYERLVERLLRSPHYGERWARIWLDAARYADSDGYEKDKVRQVWAYRDWVVSALNRDLPYNQFVMEQLAGDLLPDASQDQVVATGFLRNSMINEEGGIDPEQFRMTAMFDRMDALGKAVLGLTVQCAQCHNHKYDPLTQQEYYRLFAFLNNDHEANVTVFTPDQQMQRADVLRRIEEIEADLRHRHPDWEERMAKWESQARGEPVKWQVMEFAIDEDSTGGQRYLPQPDGSYLALGYAPTFHTVLMTTTVPVSGITGFRLELMTDPNLPSGGPGRSIWGTGALSEFRVSAGSAEGTQELAEVRFAEATADFNPPETPLPKIFDDRSGKTRVTGPVAMAIDGRQDTAWCTDEGPGRRNVPRVAVFRTDKPLVHASGTKLQVRLVQNHGGWNSDDNQSYNLGRLRISYTTDPQPRAAEVPARLLPLLEVPRAERSPVQQRELFRHFRTTVAEWKAENDQIEQLWSLHPEGSTQLVLQRRDEPRATHMLHRGEFLQPRDQVQAGTPGILHPLPPTADASRLAFARWLVDPQSPTVARSWVNRVWQACFGLGLVETPEDFGLRGAPPSHPELLDWLAVEFMERGWSLKELHRLIVGSSTYRQSSAATEAAHALDPQNRWLGRGARFRLDAELVRDGALAASGLLNRRLGGPSVHPPLPEFLVMPPVSYGPKPWPAEAAEEQFRRAIYTFRFRSIPYPALEVFDAPNGDFACVKRSRSNTPLQALATLNEPLFVQCAESLARLMEQHGGASLEDRIEYGFRRCLARRPTPREIATLVRLYTAQRTRSTANAVTAETPPNQTQSAAAQTAAVDDQALVEVARVLLNLDETITRE